jgi:hypothetical protein
VSSIKHLAQATVKRDIEEKENEKLNYQKNKNSVKFSSALTTPSLPDDNKSRSKIQFDRLQSIYDKILVKNN